jgi:hypothetical protein
VIIDIRFRREADTLPLPDPFGGVRGAKRDACGAIKQAGTASMSVFKRETGGLGQVEAQVEGEIREFVRRDVAGLRRQPQDADGKMVADNISSLLHRVSVSSVQEIDRLIHDLQVLRDRLHIEGERVQREIVEYASLSQAAMQSTKIISESLNHWKKVPDAPALDEGA